MDLVSAELGQLRQVVGSSDRAKIDGHLQGLREIEARLQSPLVVAGAGCAPPATTAQGRLDVDSSMNMQALSRLQLDITAAALACDLTRVVSLQFRRHAEEIPFLGIANYHGVTHDPPSSQGMIQAVTRASRYFHQEIAYLLGKLKAVDEGGRSLLYSTVLLAASEVTEPNAHSHGNHQYLLAGQAGGYLRTGRYVRYDKQGANRLLVSICQAMGLSDVTHYGDIVRSTEPAGPLDGLSA